MSRALALWLLFSLPLSAQVSAETVARLMHYSEYQLALIEKSLQVTEPQFGKYSIALNERFYPARRVVEEVKDGGNINIFAGPAIKNLTASGLIPIPIPIHKGLSGMRIMLIRSGDQKLYTDIRSQHELKKLVSGQILSWIDVNILETSNFTVRQAPDTDSLLAMLEAGHIDNIPLGADTVLKALQNGLDTSHSGIEIEQSKIIYYPLPFFFFVSNKSPELAKRIRTGLEMMMDSGEFDQIFYTHFDETLAKLKLHERTIFRLENTYLSDQVPLNRNEFWLIENYSQLNKKALGLIK